MSASATRERLRSAALDLFERHGYRAVTVEDIAAAAGVSHMTFFRHFRSKDRVLLDDPFDPKIAEAVRTQPGDLAPIERVARGLLTLVPLMDRGLSESTRRGLVIAGGIPELAAGMAANTAATEAAIARTAVPGTELATRMAAAACLAAVTLALLEWAASDDAAATLGGAVTVALVTVVPSLAVEA